MRHLNSKGCSLIILLGLVGCAADDQLGGLTKDEARQGGGKTDDGTDQCQANGWYGDGTCDTFCVQPDPDCTGDVGCIQDDECLEAANAFCHLTSLSNDAYDPPRPPSTQGECVYRDGERCNVDEDCAAGYSCQGDCGMGKCRGMCRLDREVADGCIADWGCDPGQKCLFRVSTDPGTGAEVLHGECRSAGSGLCNVDADCAGGQFCRGAAGAGSAWGECADAGCDQLGADCGCQDDTYCLSQAGAFCHLRGHSNANYDPPLAPSTEGQCILRDGESCNVDADCAEGFSCQQDCAMGLCAGRCMVLIPVAEGCSADWECEDGQGCFLYTATNPNDGVTTVNGECFAKGSGHCNVDVDCSYPETCQVSSGMGKSYGVCSEQPIR